MEVCVLNLKVVVWLLYVVVFYAFMLYMFILLPYANFNVLKNSPLCLCRPGYLLILALLVVTELVVHIMVVQLIQLGVFFKICKLNFLKGL